MHRARLTPRATGMTGKSPVTRRLALTAALLLSGCAYASMTGTVAPDIALSGYQQVLVTTASAARPVIVRELIARGYRVTLLDSDSGLADLAFAEGSAMILSCTYIGHSLTSLLGATGANASCDAVDLQSKRQIYTGHGKHTGLTREGDIDGAVRNALNALPARGSTGSQGSYASLPFRTPRTPARAGQASAQRAERHQRHGTGFLVADRLLLTNAHVVDSCAEVRANNQKMRIVASDRTNDLALLRGEIVGPSLPIRARPFPRLGESVTALGFPLASLLSSQLNVTGGNISALAGPSGDTRLIQTTAPVQPGNSGGPLIDEAGAVVGVIVATLDAARVLEVTGDIPQNVNFAISPAIVRAFLDANEVPYVTPAAGLSRPRADVIAAAAGSVAVISCR